MPATPLEPLARASRRYTFFLLLALFTFAIPALYLYATGYRIDWATGTSFVSTGGMFISAERTGAEIYIDDELVRETRVFRRAFYAQSIDPGTHRVHVQREGSHTWVKELPVYAHLVTEAQAFNLPLVPEARVITRYLTPGGVPVVSSRYTLKATSTQALFVATTSSTASFEQNGEFTDRLQTLFATATPAVLRTVDQFLAGGSATTSATSTKESNGVRLFESQGDIYASWVGPRESMPYYYCAEPFPRMSTSTEPLVSGEPDTAALVYAAGDEAELIEVESRVQEVAPDQECKPNIRLDRKGQKVSSFDFFPGTTDIAVLALEHGVYAVEVDDRSWQNVQPIMEGDGLKMRVDNGRVYISDGTAIYEMVLE